jgi:hypothetical protein
MYLIWNVVRVVWNVNRLYLLLLALISWIGHKVLNKELELHSTVAVDLDALEDLVDFVLLECLTERRKNVLDFDGQDVAIALLVEDLHTFEEVLLGTGGWEFGNGGEDWEELVECYLLAVEVFLGWLLTFVESALPLLVGGCPAEGSDGRADLTPVDLALAFVIEEFPVVLPFFDLIAVELVCHRECRATRIGLNYTSTTSHKSVRW